jgi:multidrug efflux system membrane fusion protein
MRNRICHGSALSDADQLISKAKSAQAGPKYTESSTLVIRHRRPSFTLLAALLPFAALLALTACNSSSTADSGSGKFGKGGGKGKNFGGAGPVPVITATVTQKNVPIDIQVVGNVEAYSVVSVRAQVGGQITKVNIQDGQEVKKDTLLFTIDSRPIEGQMNQANANLLRSQAQLEQAEANLQRDMAQERNARAMADRAQKLFDEKLISREQAEQLRAAADVQTNALNADRAAINSAKAQIEADKSVINNLKVQLGYTTVEAPIDGRIGTVTTKLGNIAAANTTELVQILQVEPIYVSFAVPEARLADVKRYMGSGTLPVTAKAQDGTGDAETGQLTFIDNSVDTSTGTIKLKATFQNKGHKLWPGQFVNVTLRLTTRGGALVVPNQAVQTGQDGTFVYVVKDDRTVEVRPVVTGPRIDLDLVIEKGLQAGEIVVTEGQLRLQPGARVQMRGEGGRGAEGRGGDGQGKDSKAGAASKAVPEGGGKEGGFKRREGGGGPGEFKSGFRSGGGGKGRTSD